MGITTDRNDPGLNVPEAEGKQNISYLVLSEEERAKGFVRPVRNSYIHVGKRPVYRLRDLTDYEKDTYASQNYVKYEVYPDGGSSIGRFWTEEGLNSGCGTLTRMGEELSETYSRDPEFYGATFCCGCGKHFPVGKDGEFVWDGTDERVGT